MLMTAVPILAEMHLRSISVLARTNLNLVIMKRSKKIHLVLITAALASCNRTVIPSQSPRGLIQDSTLTQTPDEEGEGPDRCVCTPVNSDSSTISLNEEYPGIYFPGQIGGNIYIPSGTQRRGVILRSHHFVFRGGFGKSGSAVGS